MAARSGTKPWWQSEKDQAFTSIIATVTEIEARQSAQFERFLRLDVLYDPNSRSDGSSVIADDKVVENVIASNVDTVTAVVAATDVRARFMTDGADWSMQRQARHLEWYAEGVGTQLGIAEKCRMGFKGAAKKGTGLNHVYVDRFDQLRVEPVIVDDIIVDENETRYGGQPKQMHRRRSVDVEELKAEYPGHDEVIDRALSSGGRNRRAQGSGGSQLQRNEVHVIYSWRLPIGVLGKKGYVPGRYVVSIDSADLVDEKWEKAFFPFAVIRWSEREGGWYGISLAERIAGHQRALNKRNWQINRVLDQGASVTTYVRPSDANMAVKSQSVLGTIAVCTGDYPHTVTPPQVNPEVYQNREQLKASAFEESGISRMAAQAAKPAGIDSGVAMREYRDQTTQRFSMQEKAFEQFNLDTVWLVLDCCKDMGKEAPVIMRRTKFGARKITWAKVDMGDVKVQIAAASTLSRTPAGRIQTVLEWAQAGIISQDETRRLLQHPDLERAMSLYTAAIESVEYCFDEIADGHTVMPEPFMNLAMIVSRGQSQYLKWSVDAAPERVLEALRQFVVQAAYMVDQKANPQQDNAAMPMDPTMGMGTAPAEAPPQAALAAQAMQLRSA